MTETKRGPGRPKNPVVTREVKRPETKWAMKARPEGWDDETNMFDEDANPNKQQIPRHMIPEGMDMRWVTDCVYGKPFAEWRSQAERNGWTPVHPEDFDSRFDGVYSPKGTKGECRVEGQVLMARPAEISYKAKQKDRRAALEQVAIKEQALTGGDLNTSLDSRHETALRSNRINKSIERIRIPDE